MDFKDVKQRFIDYLGNMELDKLNMMDLSTYSNIIRTMHDTERADYFETIVKMMTTSHCTSVAGEVKDNG